ncbi:hypothetical protein ACWLN7_001116 [Proteus mirabilis]|nr:hypothetical protein [Proteus mirabilis]
MTKIKKQLKMNLLISLRNATCQCFGCLREAPTGDNNANVPAI